MSEPIIMLDIEQRLRDDETGTVRDQLVEEMRTQARSIKRQLDAGVAPDEFKTLDALRAAYEAAAVVIPQSWQQLRTPA